MYSLECSYQNYSVFNMFILIRKILEIQYTVGKILNFVVESDLSICHFIFFLSRNRSKVTVKY